MKEKVNQVNNVFQQHHRFINEQLSPEENKLRQPRKVKAKNRELKLSKSQNRIKTGNEKQNIQSQFFNYPSYNSGAQIERSDNIGDKLQGRANKSPIDDRNKQIRA